MTARAFSPPEVLSPRPSQSYMHSLSLSRPPPPSSVIAVRVKEDVDAAPLDKAPSPELPVSLENIKQETDD